VSRAEDILRQAYAAARRQAGPQACVAALHIGAEQTGIAVGQGAEPDWLKLLPMGAEQTARTQFRRSPPTPLDLENAIQAVEDLVMPLHRQIPAGAQLASTDAALHEIASLSGVAPSEPLLLSLEAMERCFNRLAAVVEGSPAAQQGLPDSNPFAARLLILREVMHHLQFGQLLLLHAH
jgi:exopolyphosphatase/pppGpp-phosphohydrolase